MTLTKIRYDDYVRAGDFERGIACDELAKHFTAGRLSQDEMQQRISTALSAKTRGELYQLFYDLPRLTPQPVPLAQTRKKEDKSIAIIIMIFFLSPFLLASLYIALFFLSGLIGVAVLAISEYPPLLIFPIGIAVLAGLSKMSRKNVTR